MASHGASVHPKAKDGGYMRIPHPQGLGGWLTVRLRPPDPTTACYVMALAKEEPDPFNYTPAQLRLRQPKEGRTPPPGCFFREAGSLGPHQTTDVLEALPYKELELRRGHSPPGQRW